jgi:hypothetical protein
MFRRLKTALVDSFVGAIAAGYLLAEALENIGYAFAAPFSHWMSERALQLASYSTAERPSLSLSAGLTSLLLGSIYLLISLVLVRWLYFDYPRHQAPLTIPEPEEVALGPRLP